MRSFFSDDGIVQLRELNKTSYVIPSAVEGPRKCGERHSSRRGPSTSLRMTAFFVLRAVREKRARFQLLLISRYIRAVTRFVPGCSVSIRICFRNQRSSIFCADTTSKRFASCPFES